MKMQFVKLLFATGAFLLMLACNSKPKVIESAPAANINNSPSFHDIPSSSSSIMQEHKVVVNEVLNTEKYNYLNVTENGDKFWIAISKRDVAVGDTFYYKGGLLKKNFYSQEFDRTFETVFLVSEIWKEPSGSDGESANEKANLNIHGSEAVDLEIGNIQPAEGAIKIAELISNKEKYNGKTVIITGKCIKVNPMIMNRNWLHIKDSSSDDLDLTVTTTENIALGAVVTLEGTIALDRDFGAGYRYDIIMEGAVVK